MKNGDVYKTKGINMDFDFVEVKVKLIKVLDKSAVRRYQKPNGKGVTVFDCIIESDGCKMYASISGLYL